MSKKIYNVGSKQFRFNNEKFRKLCEKYAKDKYNGSKRKVYMGMAKKWYDEIDAYKTIENWATRNNGPRDATYFDDIAEFFNVSIFDFLDEMKNDEENEMNNKIINKTNDYENNTEIIKFNSVQIDEFLRIKNFVLNFLYTYYSSYMTDCDLAYYDRDGCEFYMQDVVYRLLRKNNIISPNEYFTDDELKEIEMAIINEEEYNSIVSRLSFPSMLRILELCDISKEYDGFTIEERKFVRENRHRMHLLQLYSTLKNFGYKILLRQEIDKSLSILPYEVYLQLIQLIDIIPSPNWQQEYDNFEGWDNNDYNINNTLDISLFLSKNPSYDNYNVNNASDTTQDLEELENLVFSINNRIMNVHKIFYNIMMKYID